jgi:hypothetical protein
MTASPFENFSSRTMAVVMTMIREAQQRGAAFVDLNDLVFALIAEDQVPLAPILFDEPPVGSLLPLGSSLSTQTSIKEHEPYFSPRLAVTVLIKLNAILPRSSSFPANTEMRTSPALDRVFVTANKLPSELSQGLVSLGGNDRRPPGMYQAVVPLDLLAAVLREDCEGAQIVREAGIIEEKVLETIRAGGDLENWRSRPT